MKGEFITTVKHPGTLPETKESALKLLFTQSGYPLANAAEMATGKLS